MNVSKILCLVAFSILGATGCAESASVDSASSSAISTGPTAAAITPAEALRAMKRTAPVWGRGDALFAKVPAGALPAPLAQRFANAEAALEHFTVAHADMGGDGTDISYVFADATRSAFVGYIVRADGIDDADFYHARAIAYYSTSGQLLDTAYRSEGIADNELRGSSMSPADYAELGRAVSFDADGRTLDVHGTKIRMSDVAFGDRLNAAEAELETWVWQHADMGNNASDLYRVDGANGAALGYVLALDATDDSDEWSAAGYVMFDASGKAVDRKMVSGGIADTMNSDSITLGQR